MIKNNIGLKDGVEVLQTAIVSLAGTPYFEKKLDATNILLDLEWELRLELEAEKSALPEEFDGREIPWSD